MNPEVLEKYRTKKGLTKTQVAKHVGRSPGWYTHIINGDAELPTKYVPQLAELFGIKPERLAKELFSGNKLE